MTNINNVNRINEFSPTSSVKPLPKGTLPVKSVSSGDSYIHMDYDIKTHKSTFRNLTNIEIENLSQQYDVENMTTADKTKLLQQLKSSGVISEQDYNIAKYTEVPVKNPAVDGYSLMYSPEKHDISQMSNTNWLDNYNVILKHLDSSLSNADGHIKQLYKDTYSKLSNVFHQLQTKPHNGNIETAFSFEQTEEEISLTPDEITELAKKYNVKDMSSDELNELLTHLSDKGIINKSEMSKLELGAVIVEPDCPESHFVVSEDIGEEGPDYIFSKLSDRDWLTNYLKLGTFLKNQSKKNEELYQSSAEMYTKISDIFKQIADASEQSKI